ncbi:MAG: acyl carrier protein [Gammaproteobacteria bacterium]|nr:acyl carrier protein [Gammaproteobacteria bacterium]
MSTTATRSLVAELLADIAPEAELDSVADGEDLRQALDLDSMDFLNLVVALHERTGVDIPEADYPRLFTLAGMSAYLGTG